MSLDAAELGRTLGRVSPQRWSMSFAALMAAACAAIATGAASGAQSLFAIVLVVGLAGAAVARPATHTALGVLVAIVWYWLAAVDDSTTPWVVAVASTLLAFHTLVALLSTTGPSATIDAISVRRWFTRWLIVVIAAVATWAVVAMFERQSPTGSVWLTALALVVALVLTLALRARLDAPRRSSSE